MAKRFDLFLQQGSDASFRVVLSNVDLTGFSAAMQLRRTPASQIAVDELTTGNGRLQILDSRTIFVTFPHEKTETFPESLVYDLEIQSGCGKITRVLQGQIRVSREVTRV